MFFSYPGPDQDVFSYMHFDAEEIYHIYNRGNQKQRIFHSRDNYLYFLKKFQRYIAPRCDLFSWCLMPNHFHFLVSTTTASVQPIEKALIPIQYLAEGMRLLLSSYTKGVNKKLGLTGNLFQQKTKAKCVSQVSDTFNVSDTWSKPNYPVTAFHYIHQNPLRANLVHKMEDWEFSSFRDYAGLRNGKLCNKDLAMQLLDLDKNNFYKDSYAAIPEKWIEKIL